MNLTYFAYLNFTAVVQWKYLLATLCVANVRKTVNSLLKKLEEQLLETELFQLLHRRHISIKP